MVKLKNEHSVLIKRNEKSNISPILFYMYSFRLKSERFIKLHKNLVEIKETTHRNKLKLSNFDLMSQAQAHSSSKIVFGPSEVCWMLGKVMLVGSLFISSGCILMSGTICLKSYWWVEFQWVLLPLSRVF